MLENVELPLLLAGEPDERAGAPWPRWSGSACASSPTSCRRRSPAVSRSASRWPARSRGQPRLILADEPTGQLDHASAELVVDVLLAAADHADAALVVVHPRPGRRRPLATRWQMASGRLTAEAAA